MVKSRIEYSHNRLYQEAYPWSRDRALAEDLVQECMPKALSSKFTLKDSRYLDRLDDYAFTSISDVEIDYPIVN